MSDDEKESDSTIAQEEQLIINNYEHDWYDPEIVWQSTYSENSIRISNYALRFICKKCLIEVTGVTGSGQLIDKLNSKDCIE